MKLHDLLLTTVLVGSLSGAAPQAEAATKWVPEATIALPHTAVLFLAADSAGSVFATTFNPRPVPDEVVAVKIARPSSSQPSVTVFDRFVAPANRGYSGIAVDKSGNIYLALDLGDGLPSSIRKYTPNLQRDKTFGRDGELVSQQLRIQGLCAHGERILAAVSWGRFLVIDSKGNFLGMTPSADQQAFIRDIAYIPQLQAVAGADRDGLYVFEGGTLENLGAYRLREVIPPKSAPKAGCAVYYAKRTNEIFFTNTTGGGMGIYPVDGGALGMIPAASGELGALQPADAVMSDDGKWLYVSDLRAPRIVRYRRATEAQPSATPSTTPSPEAAPSTRDAPRPDSWFSSMEEARNAAKTQHNRIVVFFHAPENAKSKQLDQSVFTKKFRQQFPNALWVRYDVGQDPSLYTRFNFYRAPLVILYDVKDGRELKRLEGVFTQKEFREAYEASK
ncbi:MAG: hypothetical protein KatS3mg130_1274 [Candidatus Sumerlaea sp.]|nr:MAG: hypothetical protein KatS3mg130_1274 [Candidatus Sumerlaea sp.]